MSFPSNDSDVNEAQCGDDDTEALDIRLSPRVIPYTPDIDFSQTRLQNSPLRLPPRCLGDDGYDDESARITGRGHNNNNSNNNNDDVLMQSETDTYASTLGYAQKVSHNTKNSVWFTLPEKVVPNSRRLVPISGSTYPSSSNDCNRDDSVYDSVCRRKGSSGGTTHRGLLLRPHSSIILKPLRDASIDHSGGYKPSVLPGYSSVPIICTSTSQSIHSLTTQDIMSLEENQYNNTDCRRTPHPLSDGGNRYDKDYIYKGHVVRSDQIIAALRGKHILEEIERKIIVKERLAVLNSYSTIIQSIARMWLARRRYIMHTRQLRETLNTTLGKRHYISAVIIQKHVLGMLCRRQYLRLRQFLWDAREKGTARASGGGVRAQAAISRQQSSVGRRRNGGVTAKSIGVQQGTSDVSSSVMKGDVKVPTVFPWLNKIVQRNRVFVEGIRALLDGNMKKAKELFKSFSSTKGSAGDPVSLRLARCIDVRLERDTSTTVTRQSGNSGSNLSKIPMNSVGAPRPIRGKKLVSTVVRGEGGVRPSQKLKIDSVNSKPVKDRVLSTKRKR